MGKTTTAWLILALEPLPHSEIQQNSECDIPDLLPTIRRRVTESQQPQESRGTEVEMLVGF